MPDTPNVETAGGASPTQPQQPPPEPLPPTPPSSPKVHWQWTHTAGLLLIVVFLVLLAIYRPLNMYVSWIVVMLAILAFALIAGHGIRGVWRGAFIDERNKISLSRFQMLTWTILVLSAFGIIATARAVFEDPLTALDVAVPRTLWLLMGISTVSLVGSPLIKSTKAEERLELATVDPKKRLAEQGGDPAQVQVAGRIVFNRDIRNAKWSDLFLGEEVGNCTHLDLAKIQMFFFTLAVVLTYAVAIGTLLQAGTVPEALPDVSEGMVAVLGISHSGYLANKAIPSPRPPQG